jgi:hypothetical protein
MRGDRKMIDLLCAYGAARAVHLLAHYGDVQTAAAVFAANPALADDPDALANAAGQGHESFVRLMLRYQPDLARRVTFSAWTGAPTRELNELLFQHGMDPNQPNWLRITSLHQMAEAGDVDKASIFIERGADLHARDEELRSTPLGYAAKYGKTLLVEFLLRRGAKPVLPDDPPWATPMAWAIRRGHDEIVRLLERFEADGSLPPPRSLAQYESLANDFVEAYGSENDTDALQRIAAHFQLRRLSNADQLRAQVRARLGLRPTGDDGQRTLSLADAQSLVARGHGFDSWSQLLNVLENP